MKGSPVGEFRERHNTQFLFERCDYRIKAYQSKSSKLEHLILTNKWVTRISRHDSSESLFNFFCLFEIWYYTVWTNDEASFGNQEKTKRELLQTATIHEVPHRKQHDEKWERCVLKSTIRQRYRCYFRKRHFFVVYLPPIVPIECVRSPTSVFAGKLKRRWFDLQFLVAQNEWFRKA